MTRLLLTVPEAGKSESRVPADPVLGWALLSVSSHEGESSGLFSL